MQIGGATRPVRVRVLDLPFTAVEWVLPSDMLQAGGDPLTPAKWMVWDRSPLAKERSLAVSPFVPIAHAVNSASHEHSAKLMNESHAAPVSSRHKGVDVDELHPCVCINAHLSIIPCYSIHISVDCPAHLAVGPDHMQKLQH